MLSVTQLNLVFQPKKNTLTMLHHVVAHRVASAGEHVDEDGVVDAGEHIVEHVVEHAVEHVVGDFVDI